MAIQGGCHCGAVRYAIDGEPLTHALCHCRDCRKHAGAPMVGWTMYLKEQVRLTKGSPKVYVSSASGRRHFCSDCGTGVFYFNDEMLPGIVDVQSCTADDPDAIPARVQIQLAERISWMRDAHTLPGYDRYPPQDL